MPTIATQPSLRNTQAVGAALLRQFARQRFLEAGVDDGLIQEAESEEILDQLNFNPLQEDQNETVTSEIVDVSRTSKFSTMTNASSTIADQSIGSTSTNISATTIMAAANSTSSTLNLNGSHNQNDERYHSISESNTSNGVGGDNTVYHSMNAGLGNSTGQSRLQSSPIMESYGRELRRIAEEFERSPMRQAVRERAERVQLVDISKETFIVMLEELFQGGITSEKIVTLFFFCTDLALRAAEFAKTLVVKLMGWSFSYIIDTVCKIVHELGGWDHILFRQLPSLLISCCALLGVCLLTICLRKSLARA